MFARMAPLVFVCLWATGFIGARLGMPYSEPGTFLAIRFGIAFVLLVAFAAVLRAPWPGWRLAFYSVVVGVFIHGVYLGGVFWSIDRGMPAGVAAVVVGLQPLFTALLAGIWLKEAITGRHWLGLALGLAGVVAVLAPKIDIADSGITMLTIAVCFMGMLSVTFGTVLQKQIGASLDLRSGTALQYLGAFMPVALLSVTQETQAIDWTAEMVVAMVWSVVVLSFLAIFLLMWLIREGSVSGVASLFFLVPGVASLMAWALFGETMGLVQIVGMVLCALAVFLASNRPRPE